MSDRDRERIAYINSLHNAVVDPRYLDQFRCNCGETFRWGDDWELHRADALIAAGATMPAPKPQTFCRTCLRTIRTIRPEGHEGECW